MKNSLQFGFSSLLCLVCLVGCGRSGLAPVSGVVTVNGKPTANVRVIFAPMATQETNAPGPPSWGVTDEDGSYILKSRDGDKGAVVGTHNVSFYYDDLEHLEDLKSWLSNAEDEEDAAAARAKIEQVEKEIARRGAISKSSKQTIDVPDKGLQDANFEVGEQKE